MQSIDSSKQLKMGAVLSYAAIAFNILSGLLYTPWMLKQIGQSDYGLYSAATAFLSYFTVDFGLGNSISRFVSKYRAEGEEEKIERLLGVVYKIYLAIDVLVLIAVLVSYCFLHQIFGKFTPEELEKFRLVFIIMGAFTLISFPCTTFSGILTAYERFAMQKITGFISKVGVVVCMIVALSFGGGLYALVLVNVLVHLAVHLMRFAYMKKKLHLRVDWKCFDKSLLKEVFSFSVWMMVITLAERFIFNIEPTIIGTLSGAAAVSVFAVSNTIEGYVWTFANALNSLFLPKVFRVATADGEDRTRINAMMVRVGRIQMIVVSAIVFIFASMGHEFIRLWIGDGYQLAYYVTLLLILPSLILRMLDIADTLTWAENKLKIRSISYVSTAVISTTLSVILVPHLQALGAGIAIFAGMVLGQIVGGHLIYTRILHLDMWGFYRNCQLKMLLPGVLCMAAGFALQHYLPCPNLFWFALKACVAGGVYIIAVWFLYMNESEKELFLGAFKKIKRKLIKK